MALAFATSPVGAHHKDCWTLGWEATPEYGFGTYSEKKIKKIIEFQRIRGGMFEVLVVCRFPWIELGFDLEWYPKFLKAATNQDLPLSALYAIGDKIYDLIRLFWIKHHPDPWTRIMDTPPKRLFTDPLTQGPFKGEKLDPQAFNKMLSRYYELRGWTSEGIPTKDTLIQHGLVNYVDELSSSEQN
jgi:aldehyde:ferredoxin oxidoreductase